MMIRHISIDRIQTILVSEPLRWGYVTYVKRYGPITNKVLPELEASRVSVDIFNLIYKEEMT